MGSSDLKAQMASLEARLDEIKPLFAQKRRPFFVEFAGTPKAGKTSTLSAINRFFNRNGINSFVYQERASVSPLSSKGSTNFNVWVSCATLLGMLEALENEKLDVVILDRGLFDGLGWNDWQERTLRTSREESAAFRAFLLSQRWRSLVDAVIVMHCDPTSALRREHANQVTVKPGSVMNPETLRQLREHVLISVERYKADFRNMFEFDTTDGGRVGIVETNMEIANRLLDVLRGFLDEEVLCVPTAAIAPILESASGGFFAPAWERFHALVNTAGTYVRRTAAEQSDDLTQIIPVLVIEWNGKYLTNLRHEPGETLHGTLANWAGGHVRREDRGSSLSPWESVLAGLRREILEELSLAEWPTEPFEFGIVHTREDPRAARHLGVVFVGRITDTYTAKMVGWQKLRERPGKHVTTDWMTLEQLQVAPDQKDWSIMIGRHLASLSPQR